MDSTWIPYGIQGEGKVLLISWLNHEDMDEWHHIPWILPSLSFPAFYIIRGTRQRCCCEGSIQVILLCCLEGELTISSFFTHLCLCVQATSLRIQCTSRWPVLETGPRWPWEKKVTGAGIEPATSNYIHQCSKPLSYWVDKIVAICIYPTHPLMPLSLPPWAAWLRTTHSRTQLLLPCWKPVWGDLGKRKWQGLELNQQPPTIYISALNHWATELIS